MADQALRQRKQALSASAPDFGEQARIAREAKPAATGASRAPNLASSLFLLLRLVVVLGLVSFAIVLAAGMAAISGWHHLVALPYEAATLEPPGRMVAARDEGGHAVALHLHCTGQGAPTVVLEAASGRTHAAWAPVQEALANLTRVCSYDRAGLGFSGPPRSPRTLVNQLYELRTMLQASGEQPPYIMAGHSMGAHLSRAFAGRFPDEVVALYLIDPPSPALFYRPPPTPPKPTVHKRVAAADADADADADDDDAAATEAKATATAKATAAAAATAEAGRQATEFLAYWREDVLPHIGQQRLLAALGLLRVALQFGALPVPFELSTVGPHRHVAHLQAHFLNQPAQWAVVYDEHERWADSLDAVRAEWDAHPLPDRIRVSIAQAQDFQSFLDAGLKEQWAVSQAEVLEAHPGADSWILVGQQHMVLIDRPDLIAEDLRLVLKATVITRDEIDRYLAEEERRAAAGLDDATGALSWPPSADSPGKSATGAGDSDLGMQMGGIPARRPGGGRPFAS